MKILQLNLLAFGPFTNVSLDLSAGQHGVHLIYGPNEAGKSSALHALSNFLYGIPTQNSDDFIHSYQNMRIGAVLQDDDGSSLHCIRRKARTHTLRAADDETVVDESELTKLLGGIDQDGFRMRFGLSYDALVAGGNEIVRGEGDLGKSLFAAASGVADLDAVQQRLDSGAKKLFLPSGQNPAINAALAARNKLRKTIKEETLPSAEFDQHHRALAEAEQQKAKLATQLKRLTAEVDQQRRLRKAIPLVAQRRQIQDKLSTLTDAPLLPATFAEQRRKLAGDRKVEEVTVENATTEIQSLEGQLGDLVISDELLQRAARIDALQRNLGSFEKAEDDKKKLVRDLSHQQAETTEQLANLGRADLSLEAAEALRLPADRRLQIQNLAGNKSALLQQVAAAQKQYQRTQQAIDSLTNQLVEAPIGQKTGTLRDAVKMAQAEGDLDSKLRDAEAEVTHLQSTATAQLAALGGWSGSIETSQALPVPTDATVEKFEEQFDACQRRQTRLSEQQSQLEADAAGCASQLDGLQLAQDVPTEDDLATAREQRDRLWQELTKTFTVGGEGQPVDADLSAQVEAAIKKADEIADRLRREASRVAEKAHLLAQQQTFRQKLAANAQEQQQVAAQREELGTQWQQKWQQAGIDAPTPREARAWLRRLEKLQTTASELTEARRQRQSLIERREAHRQRLTTAIGLVDKGCDVEVDWLSLVACAERLAEQLDEANRQRANLAKELDKAKLLLPAAQQELEKANAELTAWAAEWKDATAQLKLRDDAEPAEANVVMTAIDALLLSKSKTADLEHRIEAIDRDAAQFATDLNLLAEELQVDVAELSLPQAVAQMVDLASQSKQAASQRDTLQTQIDHQHEKRQAAEARLSALDAQLELMCQDAQCESQDELPEAERRSEQRRACETELRQCDKALLELTAGQGLEDFVNLCSEQDDAELATHIETLTSQIEELGQQKSQLDQTIGLERGEIARMDGGPRAAAAEQQSQQVVSQILADTREYARLRLASLVLGQAITRYREKSEGPVLSRAKELFAELTLGSFEGLRPDFDADGSAVLVGVRNGNSVPVTAMSDGTADQLYLALRLASLELFLQSESQPKLPLIVDDILVKFDDDRSAAALKVLARLSEQTQVIMFTHHDHVVKLAQTALDDDILFVQRLETTASRSTNSRDVTKSPVLG